MPTIDETSGADRPRTLRAAVAAELERLIQDGAVLASWCTPLDFIP